MYGDATSCCISFGFDAHGIAGGDACPGQQSLILANRLCMQVPRSLAADTAVYKPYVRTAVDGHDIAGSLEVVRSVDTSVSSAV